MNKTALITGGSSGLGFSFAKHLGKEGYEILILARDPEKIDAAVAELNKLNIKAKGYSCDVTDDAKLKAVSETIKAAYPKIDFLILNAGMVSTTLLSDYKDTVELRKDLDTDLYGVIISAYYFQSLLKEGSKLLFISSGFGLMGSAGYSIYCAAKAGVVNFAESLRRELLSKNISVYVACPGDMDTPQFHNEVKNSPEWLKGGSPRKVMPVDKASANILSQCKGKRKFLIISGGDVKLLSIVSKILPRKLRDMVLDGMMPRPK